MKLTAPALLLLPALLASLQVLADTPETSKDGESTLKIEDVKGSKNKVSGDIDAEITNAKLRAESGSKSKFSLSMKGTYTGGSVQSAFGQKRPNLAADPGAQKFTSLDLGLNARYRWTKNDSVTGGTQFGFVTPFQGRVSKTNAINVNDPSIGYSRVGKVADLQTVMSAGYSYGTSIPSRAIDQLHQVGLSYNMMKAFQNKLSVGASAAATYGFFSTAPGQSDNRELHTKTYGGDARTQWNFGLYPQAEYAFSDKIQARTVFGYFNWKHLYGDENHYRMLQTFIYQSIGIGWAVSRDVYLYPNVQFVPDNIRSDFTNVALTASINVF